MVRFAERHELERVNEIRKQVNDVHCSGRPDIFAPNFDKEMQDIIYSVWEDENFDVIVAVRNGIICGFSTAQRFVKSSSPYSFERKFYQIVEFGVDEEFRRQGVATEMFDFIKKRSKELGFDRIELDMWEFNESALKFYESVGFKTYRRYMEFEF
ncbi:MAG: GNAT family N-acetyltransferase [Lachnospiraceae bacterium]|nr:GNAT family N-acetyltransferase [Lachnospiraceae bacterium]